MQQPERGQKVPDDEAMLGIIGMCVEVAGTVIGALPKVVTTGK